MASRDQVVDSPFAEVADAFGVERLRRHMAERRVLHLPAPGIDLESWPSRADIEALIDAGGFPTEHLRIFAGRNHVDPARMNLAAGGTMTDGAIRMFAGKRVTFALTRLERYLPALRPVVDAAERWLGDPVMMGAVLSLGEQTGIPRHYDWQGLILLQIEGSKTWRFYGDPVAGSARASKPERLPPESEPSQQVTLEAGDLLFVPSGQIHDCLPSQGSLHVGVLILHRSGLSIARALAEMAADDELLATPVPGMLGPSETAEREAACRERIAALLDRLDLETLRNQRIAGDDRY